MLEQRTPRKDHLRFDCTLLLVAAESSGLRRQTADSSAQCRISSPSDPLERNLALRPLQIAFAARCPNRALPRRNPPKLGTRAFPPSSRNLHLGPGSP